MDATGMDSPRPRKMGWDERMASWDVPAPYLRSLVMDFLLNEGFSRTARCFESESGTPFNDAAADGMSTRVEIRKLILGGDVAAGIRRIEQADARLLEELPDLRFALRRQQLLDIISKGRIDAALTFAQTELLPMVGSDDGERLRELEETMGILAFSDRGNSPSAALLGPAQRLKTATLVNAALMRRMNQREEPILHQILKRLAHEQVKLHEEMQAFPPRKRHEVPAPLDID